MYLYRGGSTTAKCRGHNVDIANRFDGASFSSNYIRVRSSYGFVIIGSSNHSQEAELILFASDEVLRGSYGRVTQKCSVNARR